MSVIYKLPLIFEPAEEGGWTIYSPAFPGLITEADTLAEAKAMVQDAFEALVEVYQDLNKPLPETVKPISLSEQTNFDILLELAA